MAIDSLLRDYLDNALSLEERVFSPVQSLSHAVWDGSSRIKMAQQVLTAAFEKYDLVVTVEQRDQLLLMMAELTGQELSCSHLLHRMGVPPRQVLKMLGVAELVGLWRHISCFDRQDSEVGDKSKGYLVDVGLAAELLGVKAPSELELHRSWGALFEAFVVNRLYSQLPEDTKLFYWRTTHGAAEVDVVLVRDGYLYPVEIKSAVHASLSNAKKIVVFSQFYQQNYHIAPGLIVYAGSRYYQLSELVFAVPWAFL